jgi:hypothetical protein
VQDIASGKVLAIRHDLTLNHHLVRLALGDAFRDHGLPEVLFMDNGRENAAAGDLRRPGTATAGARRPRRSRPAC